MIVILDYGVGNLGSLKNALRKIKIDAVISSSQKEIQQASKIIFPGVGSFDSAMNSIREHRLLDVLDDKVMQEKIPVLGICLGFQILSHSSDEGNELGFNWLQGKTTRIPRQSTSLKLPHYGWSKLSIRQDSDLFRAVPDNARFYFAHSFQVECPDQNSILSTSHYGVEFVSSAQQNNCYGVQFHPEKSHEVGLLVLKNFVELL